MSANSDEFSGMTSDSSKVLRSLSASSFFSDTEPKPGSFEPSSNLFIFTHLLQQFQRLRHHHLHQPELQYSQHRLAQQQLHTIFGQKPGLPS